MVEKEFLKLKARYEKALKYESTKYKNDTSEGKKWAEKEFKKLVNDITLFWNKIPSKRKQELWPELWKVEKREVLK